MTLPGWTTFSFTHDGLTRDVYRRGSGPGVLVMHEIPGITPRVEAFARRVADEGYTVFMPDLFGEVGKPLAPGYALGQMARACIRSEFAVLASRGSSQVTRMLRALCLRLHDEAGGPGVGAVGMCLTGNFALALMVDPWLMAPVLSQPSLPFPTDKEARRGLHVSDDDLRGTQHTLFLALAVGDALALRGLGRSDDRRHDRPGRVDEVLQSLDVGAHVADRARGDAAGGARNALSLHAAQSRAGTRPRHGARAVAL